jgi:hypothetical protein
MQSGKRKKIYVHFLKQSRIYLFSYRGIGWTGAEGNAVDLAVYLFIILCPRWWLIQKSKRVGRFTEWTIKLHIITVRFRCII